MSGRGDSLLPTESLTSTPGPGYIARPPLHHGGDSGVGSSGSAPTTMSMDASQYTIPPLSSSLGSLTTITVAGHQQQQQQHQHHHHHQQHAAKRAYRQRRKDPSCDACRERKVKCDATETTSCSECSNRQVKCQFTKETNRRMSSIKQVQDLERQLDRLRRENGGLRRILQERGLPKKEGDGPDRTETDAAMNDANSSSALDIDTDVDMQSLAQFQQDLDQHLHRHLPLQLIPDMESTPLRRHRRVMTATSTTRPQHLSPWPSSTYVSVNQLPPPLDLGRARRNLRNFARGLWVPPPPFAYPTVGSPTSTITPSPCLPGHQQQAQGADSPQSFTGLPPRDIADTLLHGYYTSVHTMFPIIHWPTFQRQVDELYGTSIGRDKSFSFTALFFAVLAVGGRFSTYFFNAAPAPICTVVHLAEAARGFLNPWSMTASPGNTPKTLDDVRALFLLAVFLNESNLKTIAWTWLTSAVCLAQGMGLHMESSNGSSEMVRRVWWALYVFDRSLALDLGNRPMLIQDDSCDVGLPSLDSEPYAQPHAMRAVLGVVRAYPSLSKLFSAASSFSYSSPNPPLGFQKSSSHSAFLPSLSAGGGCPVSSSSPISTPSPSSSFATPTLPNTSSVTNAATTPIASSAVYFPPSGTSIPATHLATFDQHFATCLRAFPPVCDPGNHHRENESLAMQQLNPVIYLFHARLVLHRHNLAPYATPFQQQHNQQARISAVEQCTHTALETATLIRRTGLASEKDGESGIESQQLGHAVGATALLASHLMRCTLFLLLSGQIDAAALLVRALASISVVRREVATPCGRFLAFFTSCLAFKRAEYTAYLARTALPQQQQQQQQQALISPYPQAAGPAPQSLYDALIRDEELLVYVSADLQSSLESAWVWDGENATTESQVNNTSATPSACLSGQSALSRTDICMGLSDEESRDWGGWEQLKNRVRSLSTLGGPASANASTPTTTTSATGSSGAAQPLPTSYSSTTTGTTSPLVHYTHQPLPSLPLLLPGPTTTQTYQQQQHQQLQPSHLPPPPTPQQQRTYPPYDTGYRPIANASSSRVMADTPSEPAAAPRQIDRPMARGSGSGSSKSKNEERISIANII